jgi:hypothetical protein
VTGDFNGTLLKSLVSLFITLSIALPLGACMSDLDSEFPDETYTTDSHEIVGGFQ